MGQHLTRRTFLAASTSAIALSALGSSPALAADDKPTITVGSMNHAEQFIMAEIISLLLEDAGYSADRKHNLGGTAVAHEGLIDGAIDTYPEYTGSGLMMILGLDVPEIETDPDRATPETDTGLNPHSQRVFEIVRDGYRKEFDVEWLEPFGFNNTYAIAVRPEMAEKHDLKTTSDLEPYAGDMLLGSDLEFPVRPDGLPGFEEAYGYSFKDVMAGDSGLMYSALDQGDVDAIAAYTTDGRIPMLNLVVLEDDLDFFPPYNAAPIVRRSVLENDPELYGVMNQLAGRITNDDIASLNYRVDEEGAEPIDVARDFLHEQGFLRNVA